MRNFVQNNRHAGTLRVSALASATGLISTNYIDIQSNRQKSPLHLEGFRLSDCCPALNRRLIIVVLLSEL